MKKILLLAAAAMLAAAPAHAVSVTGSYTVSISSDADATVAKNLPTNFTLTEGAARSAFVTVTPNFICYPSSACNPDTGTVTVVFSNLTIGSHNFGGFTETGAYTAYYGTQIDNVVWNGAVANNGAFVGLDQDGSVPLVFTKLLGDAVNGFFDVNLIDGADWNVATYIEVSAAAATPLPGALMLFGSGGAILGLLMTNGRKKRTLAS